MGNGLHLLQLNNLTITYTTVKFIMTIFLSGLDAAAGMEDSELPNISGEQSLSLDNSGSKLTDFANRPAGKNIRFCVCVHLLNVCISLQIFHL